MLVEMSCLDASEEKQCCRWGGIAALLLAIGYVAIIPLFVWAGAPPATGEAWFRYLPGKTTVWWAILWLSGSNGRTSTAKMFCLYPDVFTSEMLIR